MPRKATSTGSRAKAPTGMTPPGVLPSDLAALMFSLGRLAPDAGSDDLDRAQEKAFDAMEAPDRRRRIALARQALAISPLCSDALLVLAREAASPEEALAGLRRAVEAGTQALGEETFERDAGMFWGLIGTRPYMRARHELALALWDAGDREEAVLHYGELLRLNPNDNQGIRYLLLDALLALGREEEAADLLGRYDEDGSAAWAWSRALLAFRRDGDGATSRNALAQAVGVNPHVPPYLTGKKRLPRALPQLIGRGDEAEAVSYAHDAGDAWAAAPGATAWVAEVLAGGLPGPRRAGRPAAEEPSAAREEPEADPDRIDDAVLALLLLGLHDGNRVWKGFDWEAMDRLHARGLISSPAGRARSVVLTDEGLQEARRLHGVLFGRRDGGAR